MDERNGLTFRAPKQTNQPDHRLADEMNHTCPTKKQCGKNSNQWPANFLKARIDTPFMKPYEQAWNVESREASPATNDAKKCWTIDSKIHTFNRGQSERKVTTPGTTHKTNVESNVRLYSRSAQAK